MTPPSPRPESADRHVRCAGFTLEEIFNLTKMGRKFLSQMKEIVDCEAELAAAKGLIE